MEFNVCALLYCTRSNHPERWTTLIVCGLACYIVQIAPRSKTRLAEEGQLTEQSAGYTFFWISHGQDERCNAGVGFAIKSNLVSKLAAPQGDQ